jgi:quercetin dioxygenase-like cupin family protein
MDANSRFGNRLTGKGKNHMEPIKSLPQSVVLEEMVDYQEGTVVSRTVIDKKTGTVTLFAFDQDQGLSEHTAPFDAMVHVLDGEAEITIAGKPYLLAKGEMIIMPAGEPHALKAVLPFKMMLTMIRS